jgi:ribonuclease HI
MTWTASIDGGARGNPGPAAAGIHISDPSGSVVFSGGLFLGHKTSNEAEYAGLLSALDLLNAAGADDVTIRSDSELLVRQMQGRYRVKAPNLQPLYDRATTALRRLGRCEFIHVRREENKQADTLANQAMDAVDDVIVADPRGLWSGLDKPAPAGRPATLPSSRTAGGTPITSSTAPSRTAARATAGAIVVAVVKAPKPGTCPAGTRAGQTFIFTETTPAGLCVEACAAVIDAVAALQSTPGATDASTTPITVTCGHPECSAVFQLKRT